MQDAAGTPLRMDSAGLPAWALALLAGVGACLLLPRLPPWPWMALLFVLGTALWVRRRRAGVLGVLLWFHIARPRLRNVVALSLAALILLIGFSRLYVHDHYLGDVLAGYAVGLSWLALCVGVWAIYRPHRGVLQ